MKPSVFEIGIRTRIMLSSTSLVGILTRIAPFYGNEKFHMGLNNVSRKLILTGILTASGFSDQKSCVCLHSYKNDLIVFKKKLMSPKFFKFWSITCPNFLFQFLDV